MSNTVLYQANASEKAVFIVVDKNGNVKVHDLGIQTRIGRSLDRSVCDIVIDSQIVSRVHGEIVRTNGVYYYRDLESTNGTYVNKQFFYKSIRQEKGYALLEDGDIFSFDIKKNEVSHPEKAIAIFSKCFKGEAWEALELHDEIAEVCIGRADTSSLKMENEMISEKHASFFHACSGWAVIDHNSTNGVFLNAKRLGSPRYLSKFDVVRIADSYFVYMDDKIVFSEGKKQEEQKKERKHSLDDKKGSQLVINIVERSVVQRFKKMMLLQDINISISNGEMLLILGGSGAGKTTFINAVMGYEKAVAKIVYKGTDIYQEYEQMKYEIGFVPQQDLLRGSDTVYATLANAAEMKLPKRYGHKEREKRIEQMLEEFGLSREKHSLVSKLSGGQRKRLSIAVEFIADPSLFFLDEPDSGIDDVMGRGIMKNLRKIADLGKIVMVITHSPERALDLFDKVIVLAKSEKDNCGHLAFYGTVDESFEFFGVKSFREIVRKINRPDENGEGLSDYYIEKYNNYVKKGV